MNEHDKMNVVKEMMDERDKGDDDDDGDGDDDDDSDTYIYIVYSIYIYSIVMMFKLYHFFH